jgi:chaperonin GroES
MKIRPLGDRVVVERDSKEEKSAGGILLPDNAREKPQMGKVLSVGDGKQLKNGERRPLQVKAGDKVYFTAWAGDEYKSGDKNVLIMREDDILAIID